MTNQIAQILEALCDGTWKPLDTLTQMFPQRSRARLREHLYHLAHRGYLERTKGHGGPFYRLSAWSCRYMLHRLTPGGQKATA